MSDQMEGYQGPPESPVEQIPTHQAAAMNNVAELESLVQEGAQLLSTETKETPLHAAAKRGALDTLAWLLENKTASPLDKASNGNTAAHYAAVYGHSKALKLLIEHDASISNKVVTQVDESGLSLVSLATLQGDMEIVQWLLENYPQVGEMPNANGDLAVHFAAAQGHVDILKLLVKEFGREVAEKQDKNSTKPVYFASQEGQLAVLDYLVNELGVDPVAREKSGVSTVHAATQAGQYKATKWLISKLGPKYILDKTVDGATPLHMAAAQGHTDILRYLLDNLEHMHDVNIRDNIYATPAHDAAEYGQTEAMLLLLRNGADVTIKDRENKTPYELAVEQGQTSVATMLADFRDNGPVALAKYEKKKRSNSQPHPRTSRQEAVELSAAIQQSTSVQEHRKTQQMRRQESLQRMNETGLDDDGGGRRKPRHKSSKPSSNPSDDEIEHTLGPQGDIYARPKKRKHHRGRKPGSDEDLLDETASHRSYGSAQQHSYLDTVLPLDESAYASVNHETASNYSRPSRVRHYHDSDSEITSVSSRYHQDGRHNVPGFYPPYGGFYPHPMAPLPRKGHHSSAGSVHSSKGGRAHQPPHGIPMMAYGPYGYYPMPYPPYGYPYPPYATGYRPKTTEERMHLEALQRSRGGHLMGPTYYYAQQQRGRRSKLNKKVRSRAQSREPSPPPAPRQHTDTDIGYGPAISQDRGAQEEGGRAKKGKGGAKGQKEGFHPPAPPITKPDGTVEGAEDVVKFDSNFIMMKKSETSERVKQLGDTTLNLARAPTHYDGRWDAYIMTDSESEHEVDEDYCVAFAAETAAILAIGCVSGLKGLKKLRKGPLNISDITQPDKSYLSSAWDEPPMPHKGHARHSSLSGVADPSLREMSPEDFAAREELSGHTTWGGERRKGEGKKEKAGDGMKKRSASDEHLDKPQSELLTDELQKQSYASVSRSFGQKMLFDALGARDSSMLNIASSSLAGSRMSIDVSSDEGDGEDDFGDAIQMVHGLKPAKRKKKREKEGEERREGKGEDKEKEKMGGKGVDTDKERPQAEETAPKTKNGKKKEKQKEKEEKEKKQKEKEDKKRERKEAKKERQRKKEEEKRAGKQAKEKAKESGKKPSPLTPGQATPPSQTPPLTPTTPASQVSMETKKPEQPASLLKPKTPPLKRTPTPPAPYKGKGPQAGGLREPAATSTPVQATAEHTPKKDRREKAQLKSSSPSQLGRPRASRQKPPRMEGEGEATVASVHPLGSAPPAEDKAKEPKEKQNAYFDDETDEEEGEAGEEIDTAMKQMAGHLDDLQDLYKAPGQKPPGESTDPGISELDDVLKQLEDIQSGGLASWLEPTRVTRIDDSEDSEDSLPLEQPMKKPAAPRPPTPPAPRKPTSPAPRPPTPPHGERESESSSRSEREEEKKAEGHVPFSGLKGSPPPRPRKKGSPYPVRRGGERGREGGEEGRRGGRRGDREEEEEGSSPRQLQRTKHGSPHPGRRQGRQEQAASHSSSSSVTDVAGVGERKLSTRRTEGVQRAEQQTAPQNVGGAGGGAGGGGQPSAFEQNVLSTLEALKESMNQLKSNPSITQTEITEQKEIQQQLIQNLITYSQHNPQLVNQLLSILTENKGQDSTGLESSSTHQLDELEQKILGAHEKVYQETQEHFRTQEALQRAIQQTLEEHTQQQMKGMQANFEMFSKLMEEQLAQQRKKFEEELAKREKEEKEKSKGKRDKKEHSKKKRKKRHKHSSESESESSGSESEGMVKLPAHRIASKPAVKTMEAQIYTQELLQEELATPRIGARPRAGKLVRRETEAEFSRTTEALSRNLPLEKQVEEEEEDEDEMYFQHAKPVTIRRADIKVQRQDDYTPQRTTTEVRGRGTSAQNMAALRQGPPGTGGGEKFDDFHIMKTKPPKQIETKVQKEDFDEANLRYGRQHVEVNKHKQQHVPEDQDPLAGAGGELAAALRVRQKQIKNKEHKT